MKTVFILIAFVVVYVLHHIFFVKNNSGDKNHRHHIQIIVISIIGCSLSFLNYAESGTRALLIMSGLFIMNSLYYSYRLFLSR